MRAPRPGNTYVTPVTSAGVELTSSGGRGRFTLTAGTTYYFPLGGSDAPFQAAQLTSYTAGLVITSATIEDTCHGSGEVSDYSTVAGEWVPETPSTAYVGVTGTGWSQSIGVAASSGSALGGALWHLGESGAVRTRLKVVVGGTGGNVRVSCWGKG